MTTKELKNIAPKLAEIRNQHHGFNIPDGYFNTIEAAVFERISLDSNNLDSVPEGYFDTIENRVFEKIKSEPKVIPLKNKFVKYLLPFTAAAAILLLISFPIFNTPTTKNNDLFSKVNTSEIEIWIENGDLELTEYEITSIYKEANYDNLDLNFNYTEEELNQYLESIDPIYLNN